MKKKSWKPLPKSEYPEDELIIVDFDTPNGRLNRYLHFKKAFRHIRDRDEK